MGRELTTKEKRVIARSVIRQCANYDEHYKECLPEDASCYMMTIGFDDSPLCRYYEKAILPIEPEVAKIFSGIGSRLKRCAICGREFEICGNQQYCSGKCTDIARKRADAKRHKKYRQKKHA